MPASALDRFAHTPVGPAQPSNAFLAESGRTPFWAGVVAQVQGVEPCSTVLETACPPRAYLHGAFTAPRADTPSRTYETPITP